MEVDARKPFFLNSDGDVTLGGGTSDQDKQGDIWTTAFKCAKHVEHCRCANVRLMREEPQAIIMSQKPPNILTLHVLEDFSILFSRYQ